MYDGNLENWKLVENNIPVFSESFHKLRDRYPPASSIGVYSWDSPAPPPMPCSACARAATLAVHGTTPV